MKKVLFTGTFDIIHPGHHALFRQVRKHGDFLVIVVARDATVKKVKGYAPYFSELERVDNLKNLHIARRVLLGNRGDKLKIVEALKPDVICLGYDQKIFTSKLKSNLQRRGLSPKIVRLKSFRPTHHKTGLLHKNNLVAIKNVDPTIITEPLYATKNNFLNKPLYNNYIILTKKHIAEKLKRIQRRLRKKGLGLKIWDCYRPLSVQKMMWKFMPDERYIGKPDWGPFHTRAAAVDCTLVDKKGRQLIMPTAFDVFSRRAHRDYPHAPEKKKNMLTLELAMVTEGFDPLPTEWWHFSDPNWKQYPILDIAI